MSQSRIDWIDYSKAILIMLVVFAHCPRVPYTLDALIVGFHMPAFFIISGYLHKCQSSGYIYSVQLLVFLMLHLAFYAMNTTCYEWESIPL